MRICVKIKVNFQFKQRREVTDTDTEKRKWVEIGSGEERLGQSLKNILI